MTSEEAFPPPLLFRAVLARTLAEVVPNTDWESWDAREFSELMAVELAQLVVTTEPTHVLSMPPLDLPIDYDGEFHVWKLASQTGLLEPSESDTAGVRAATTSSSRTGSTASR